MDFDAFKKNFADKIRFLRNERKISAREMSLELGQNVNYINYIENGKHLPSMQGFFSICEYFDLPPAEFFEKPEENLENAENTAIFCALSKKQQECIIAMVKEFLT